MGNSNEVTVSIEGVHASALLDTGATVSTISEAYLQENLPHLPVCQLDRFLRVECADGEQLPYRGYIEATIQFDGLGKTREVTCLLLVVPESLYNSRVPLLLGTNILTWLMDGCLQEYEARYAQHGNLDTP